MAGLFGGVVCTIVDGIPVAPQEEADRWSVRGVDGRGKQSIGTRPQAVDVRLVYLGTFAGAVAWRDAILAMKSSQVSLTTNEGSGSSTFDFEDARAGPITAAYRPGISTHRCEIIVSGSEV